MKEIISIKVAGKWHNVTGFIVDTDRMIFKEPVEEVKLGGEKVNNVEKCYHKEKTNFKHDCDKCVFLGSVVAGGKLADLYFCGQNGGTPTVIARYSDDGSDYTSGMPLSDINQLCTAELAVARLRAEAQGLLKPKA